MMDNKKLLITFGVLILVSIGLLWWLVFPALGSISENSYAIHEKRHNLSRLLKEGQSVTENQKNLGNIESNIEVMENVWMHIGNELQFITDLEGVAEKNNLEEQVINFDNSKMEGQGDIKMVPIELILTGSLDEIMDYISDVEALSYYINFNRVEIRKTQSKEERSYPDQIDDDSEEKIVPETILTFRLSGITYWK